MTYNDLAKDPYMLLSVSIIERAIDDCVWALCNFNNPKKQLRKKAYNLYRETLDFFKSETFLNLTDIINIDSKTVLKMVQEKYNIELSKRGCYDDL